MNLLTTSELAEILRKSPEALRAQRHRNPELLPPATVIGGRVFYRSELVDQFIECHTEEPGPRQETQLAELERKQNRR